MKSYTKEDLKKMKQLKKDLGATGENERFTVKMIQRRLRCGVERANQLFNALSNEDNGK